MGFQIAFSDKFRKSYKKLSDIEQSQVKSKVRILAENPMHPSLRTKRIQGSNPIIKEEMKKFIIALVIVLAVSYFFYRHPSIPSTRSGWLLYNIGLC